MKNLLVAVDFHDKTQILIDKAYELAKAFDSTVWLLHVASPDPDFVGYDIGPQYIRDSRANELRDEHKLLQEHADQLIKRGTLAEGLLIQGATVDMILQESKKLKIDLILIGHHDHSFMYKLMFGSAANQIVDKSEIPVLLVPFN